MRLPVTPDIVTRNGVSNKNARLTNALKEKNFAVVRPGLVVAGNYPGIGNGLIPFGGYMFIVGNDTIYEYVPQVATFSDFYEFALNDDLYRGLSFAYVQEGNVNASLYSVGNSYTLIKTDDYLIVPNYFVDYSVYYFDTTFTLQDTKTIADIAPAPYTNAAFFSADATNGLTVVTANVGSTAFYFQRFDVDLTETEAQAITIPATFTVPTHNGCNGTEIAFLSFGNIGSDQIDIVVYTISGDSYITIPVSIGGTGDYTAQVAITDTHVALVANDEDDQTLYIFRYLLDGTVVDNTSAAPTLNPSCLSNSAIMDGGRIMVSFTDNLDTSFIYSYALPGYAETNIYSGTDVLTLCELGA